MAFTEGQRIDCARFEDNDIVLTEDEARVLNNGQMPRSLQASLNVARTECHHAAGSPECAQSCGFEDLSRDTRTFKKA